MTYKMITKLTYLTFKAKNEVVLFEKDQRKFFLQGLLCPSTDSISLRFELSSNILGTAIETLTIPVVRPKSLIPVYYNTQNVPDRLKIASLDITILGVLTITFNRDILRPAIIVVKPNNDQEDSSRQLQANQEDLTDKRGLFDLQDVLKVNVRYTYEDDDEEKLIQDISLQAVTNRTLEVQVNFVNPFSITSNIMEPDDLDIEFILP